MSKCPRCEEWLRLGLSATCPSCDAVSNIKHIKSSIFLNDLLDHRHDYNRREYDHSCDDDCLEIMWHKGYKAGLEAMRKDILDVCPDYPNVTISARFLRELFGGKK